MEELGEKYMNKMNREGIFGAAEIYKYAKLHNTHIVNSGCTLGEQNLAKSFYIVVRNHILDRLIM